MTSFKTLLNAYLRNVITEDERVDFYNAVISPESDIELKRYFTEDLVLNLVESARHAIDHLTVSSFGDCHDHKVRRSEERRLCHHGTKTERSSTVLIPEICEGNESTFRFWQGRSTEVKRGDRDCDVWTDFSFFNSCAETHFDKVSQIVFVKSFGRPMRASHFNPRSYLSRLKSRFSGSTIQGMFAATLENKRPVKTLRRLKGQVEYDVSIAALTIFIRNSHHVKVYCAPAISEERFVYSSKSNYIELLSALVLKFSVACSPIGDAISIHERIE